MENVNKNNPIRVSIIDPVGQKAGMDAYNLSLADALRKKAADVFIYSNFLSDKESSFIKRQFKFKLGGNLFDRFDLFFRFISALRKSKKNKCTIVILHVFHFSLIDSLFIRITRLYGFKTCLIIHDAESLIPGKGSFLNGCLKISDAVIVHNTFTRDELKAKVKNFPEGKFHIIPHGNYPFIRQPEKRESLLEYYNYDASKKYLLFFGMIKSVKGLDVLLEAMPQMPENIHLIIAGRPRDIDFGVYERMIDSLKITERVHTIVRYITNEERHLLFSSADIVVLPYRKVYQSGVLLMAMSYGLPVIASDLISNKDIINNRNGRLFISGDSSDLAGKIMELAMNDEKMQSISSEALAYVKKYHNWDDIAGEFIAVIKSIQ